MLEAHLHRGQGAGLQGLALQAPAARIVAMASHGNQNGELSLLWSLCSTLADFGYPVAVLDATTAESADNPGLEQLLDDARWRSDTPGGSLPWSVIPAALGLQQLCTRHAECRPRLDPIRNQLQGFGVIVIYARADVLTRLLPDSGIEPLLTVSPVDLSPVTAYQALKHMLQNAQLRPTIASLVRAPLSTMAMTDFSPVRNLQKCALKFLGYQPDSFAIDTSKRHEHPANEVRRLALRLLENAMPLHRNPSPESR